MTGVHSYCRVFYDVGVNIVSADRFGTVKARESGLAGKWGLGDIDWRQNIRTGGEGGIEKFAKEVCLDDWIIDWGRLMNYEVW